MSRRTPGSRDMGRRLMVAWWALTLALAPLPASAQRDGSGTGDKGADMVVDVVVVRPLGLATMLVGTVLTVVALPFTIPSGSVEASAQALIVRPAEYTFKRPLGDFSGNGEGGR